MMAKNRFKVWPVWGGLVDQKKCECERAIYIPDDVQNIQ